MLKTIYLWPGEAKTAIGMYHISVILETFPQTEFYALFSWYEGGIEETESVKTNSVAIS